MARQISANWPSASSIALCREPLREGRRRGLVLDVREAAVRSQPTRTSRRPRRLAGRPDASAARRGPRSRRRRRRSGRRRRPRGARRGRPPRAVRGARRAAAARPRPAGSGRRRASADSSAARPARRPAASAPRPRAVLPDREPRWPAEDVPDVVDVAGERPAEDRVGLGRGQEVAVRARAGPTRAR